MLDPTNLNAKWFCVVQQGTMKYNSTAHRPLKLDLSGTFACFLLSLQYTHLALLSGQHGMAVVAKHISLADLSIA